MDFKEAFINALHTGTDLTKTISLLDYLPVTAAPPGPGACRLPYLQAYGRIQASFPYYYEISGLASYCLLYTESGAGNLLVDKESHALLPNTLMFIDCTARHRIEIGQSQWNYTVLFMSGDPVPALYDIITTDYPYAFRIDAESSIPNILKKLIQHLTLDDTASFLHAKIIIDILLEIVIEKDRQKHSGAHIPDYLVKIKHGFDNNYQNSYSLDSLEKEYHICKYRICSEFTKHYRVSPIQYLNSRRIEAAKEALIYTDKRINEIGRMVGFENTNLLIRLFKKNTGITPFNYRKTSPTHTLFH